MSRVNRTQLLRAHKDIEVIMEGKEKSRLSKSLDALRSRFSLVSPQQGSDEDLTKGAPGAVSSTMPGNDGYPNDQGAEAKISRARGKSKPAKLPDGNYEDLPSAEGDTTDYENSEEDALDGFGGKKVTEKSFAATTEEDFYKSVIDSDEDGEVVAAINATDALEHLATVMGKSISTVSKQSEAIGIYATTQFVELNKSLAVLAEAVGVIVEALDKSASAFDLPVEDQETPETGTDGATELKDGATTTTEDATNKSQAGADASPVTEDQKKYERTIEWLQKATATNVPSYFSAMNGQTGMDKSQNLEHNSPEDLNTLSGRKRVRSALTSLIKSQGLNPDYLGMTDYRAPSEIVSAVPVQFREELKKLLA